MRALSTAFHARLASGATTFATAWRVTRADDTIFGFTDHDRELVFDGVTYSAGGARLEGADIAGAFNADAIAADDLARGVWDGARIDVYRVDWRDPGIRVLMQSGRLGAVSRGAHAFRADLESLDAALDAPMGRVFSRFCDADVGDARCGVDLDVTIYRGTGVVTEAMDARTFRASGLGAFADGWFARGGIAWSAGGGGDVRAHRVSGAAVIVELATAREIAEGDAFTITAGCDKRAATCRAKFTNIVNFRGFPHMPGNDALIAGPDRRQPMDGASRGRDR